MVKLNSLGDNVSLIVSGAKVQISSLRVLLNHTKVSSRRSEILYDIAFYEGIVSRYSPLCFSFDSSDFVRCLSCRYCFPPSKRKDNCLCKLVSTDIL